MSDLLFFEPACFGSGGHFNHLYATGTVYGTGRAYSRLASRLAELAPDSTVLDVGCGLGDYLDHVLDKFGRSTHGRLGIGLDESGVGVTIAQARHPHLWFAACSAQSLTAEHMRIMGTFGCAYHKCGLSMCQTAEDYRKAITNVRRLLDPGGIWASTLSASFFEKWSSDERFPWRPNVWDIEREVWGEPIEPAGQGLAGFIWRKK